MEIDIFIFTDVGTENSPMLNRCGYARKVEKASERKLNTSEHDGPPEDVEGFM